MESLLSPSYVSSSSEDVSYLKILQYGQGVLYKSTLRQHHESQSQRSVLISLAGISFFSDIVRRGELSGLPASISLKVYFVGRALLGDFVTHSGSHDWRSSIFSQTARWSFSKIVFFLVSREVGLRNKMTYPDLLSSL